MSADRKQLRVCKTCASSMDKGKVPANSLFNVDTGPIPRDDAGVELPALRLAEAALLAPFSVYRSLFVCTPKGARSSAGDRKSCSLLEEKQVRSLRGHVIPIKGTSPRPICKTFPVPLKDIPDIIQVIFLAPAASHQDLLELAKQTPGLQVRGKVIVQWARHLAARYAKEFQISTYSWTRAPWQCMTIHRNKC